jgi:DNA polymerase III subunit epsilon
MIIMSFDVESTGLSFVDDRVIEVGAVLFSTGLNRIIESQGFIVKSDVPVTKEITKITGITQNMVDKFGIGSSVSLEIVLEMMNQCDAVVGHNAVRFDRRMLQAWAVREDNVIPDKLWLDTFTDLPDTFATKLSYMAADAGYVNLFPHGALTDCLTVIKLLQGYDIEKVIERAKSPAVVVQARVTFDTNHLAKKERFRWFPDRKIWFKLMKEMDVEAFAKDAAFDITVYRENIQEFLDL